MRFDKIYTSKSTDTLIKIAAVVGALTVIAGGYSFYLNNIWRPKVEILSVDFLKGEATVKVKNSTFLIYGDSTFLINAMGDWGIRFGSSRSNKDDYDRLELTKKGMVVEYLKENK